MTRSLLFLSLALLFSAAVFAQSAGAPVAPSDGQSDSDATVGTDPSYHLSAGDWVSVNVYGEPDMSTAQRLDTGGSLRLPLVGDVHLAGKSVREAEDFLQKLYRQRELLRSPLVTIAVTGYAPREVSVLGAVRSPGSFQFPKETTSLDIVDLITRVGGFLPTAKSSAVNVIRRLPDGQEKVSVVDVASMLSGRRHGDAAQSGFLIYPGDRIWVPERLF